MSDSSPTVAGLAVSQPRQPLEAPGMSLPLSHPRPLSQEVPGLGSTCSSLRSQPEWHHEAIPECPLCKCTPRSLSWRPLLSSQWFFQAVVMICLSVSLICLRDRAPVC